MASLIAAAHSRTSGTITSKARLAAPFGWVIENLRQSSGRAASRSTTPRRWPTFAVVTTQFTVRSGTRPWSCPSAAIALSKLSARTTERWTFADPPWSDM